MQVILSSRIDIILLLLYLRTYTWIRRYLDGSMGLLLHSSSPPLPPLWQTMLQLHRMSWVGHTFSFLNRLSSCQTKKRTDSPINLCTCRVCCCHSRNKSFVLLFSPSPPFSHKRMLASLKLMLANTTWLIREVLPYLQI